MKSTQIPPLTVHEFMDLFDVSEAQVHALLSRGTITRVPKKPDLLNCNSTEAVAVRELLATLKRMRALHARVKGMILG